MNADKLIQQAYAELAEIRAERMTLDDEHAETRRQMACLDALQAIVEARIRALEGAE